MASFGIGLGAFADGFTRGVGLGNKLKGIQKENAAEKAQKEAVEAAKGDRAAQIEAETNRIMGLGPQAPGSPSFEQGGATAYPVDGGGEAAGAGTPPASAGIESSAPSREEARQRAKENLGDDNDAIVSMVSARMRDHYFSAGNIEMADKWEKYAETRQARKEMGQFGKALRAASLGDHEGFINNIRPVLEKNYGNGFKLQKFSPVKNKEGNVTGYNFEIRNTRTGEVTQNNLTTQDLYQTALTIGSPQQGFERWLDRMTKGEDAKAKAAAEVGKIQMQTQKDLTVEEARQRGRIELEDRRASNQGNKVQQELDAKISALQKAGYSEQFINNVLPDILGVNQHKRSTSPEEARRLAFSDRMKNDMRFGRLSPDEQRKIIDQDMALIYGGLTPSQAAPSGATPAQQSPISAPAPAPANPAARGLPVLDTKTGKVVYR